MNSEKQLEKLKQVFEILEDGKASTSEVAEAFAMVFQVLEALKEKMSQEMAGMDSGMRKKHSEIYGEMGRMESEMKKMHSEMMKSHSKEMNSMKMELMEQIERVSDLIPTMPDLMPLERRIGEVEKKEMPKIPQNLATLEEIEALKEELKKEIDEARKLPRGGGGAPRRVFQPYRDDFSASCDGANKTFYLSRAPLNDVIMVFGTDFPTILRPTIDFTVANKVLTLTSAVPAPSLGATLICTFFS